MSKDINTIKIKILCNYQEYQEGQVYDLKENIANSLLTTGKALRIHRKNLENKKLKKE